MRQRRPHCWRPYLGSSTLPTGRPGGLGSGDAQVEADDAGGGAAYCIAKLFAYENTRYDMGGLEYFAREPEFNHRLVRQFTEMRF